MKKINPLFFSVLLTLPVLFFILHHFFFYDNAFQPTGFTVDENVLYMSYSRQYVDADTFSFFYSNPFDGDPSSPRIYFQPATLLMGGCLSLGLAPGLCFSLFGLIMAFACVYTGVKLIEHLLPEHPNRSLITLFFTWGGGLLAITGLLGNTYLDRYPDFLDGIYLADPANGWWGLNWGRNFFIPLEAFYHFLFLLNIYLVLKERWKLSIVITLLLSISHPFTGAEYLGILIVWLIIEKLFAKNRSIPAWYLPAIALVTTFHLLYYLVYLGQFETHRVIFQQYTLGWTYSLLIAIPAYTLTGMMAIFAFYRQRFSFDVLKIPHQRLFLIWAIVSFLLSKHEWFIDPIQPIHFTRGYTWAGLFLFGLPALTRLLAWIKNNNRKWLMAFLIILFLSDNALWFGNLVNEKYDYEWEGHITNDTKQVLDYLEKNGSPIDLLVGNAALVNYLANTYSPVNSWVSHPFNTPNRNERLKIMDEYLAGAEPPEAWQNRRILILIDKNKPGSNNQRLLSKPLLENDQYLLLNP